MRDQELDRLFERFRRKGDVPALGAIFDATAPELLHVAMSLVRDPGEVDDLLQETFLSAIQRAGRYDAERRLVPWLLGILVHHAKERRRSRRRELDPSRLEPRAESRPELEIQGQELEAELERALAELGARERSVLDAYLRQGKGAAEIASETGAAPGAVRMQIHRGLDRLRKALPTGFALAAAGAANAQGLAAIRKTILRAGETAARTLAPGPGSALGAGTAGVLMANKFVVAGVVATFVVGLFLFRSLGDERAALATEEQVAYAEGLDEPHAAGVAELAAPPLPEGGLAGATTEPSARVPATSGPDLDRAGLRGRVVEHDGTPVPGLAIGLLQIDEAQLLSGALAALDGSSAPHLLAASTVTDGEGRFLLHGAAVGALSALGIDLGGERGTLRVLDAHLASGATADLGDVVLQETGALEGQLLDELGNGVVGARVRVAALPEMLVELGLVNVVPGSAIVELHGSGEVDSVFELPAWLSELESRLPFATTRTDADGRFAFARAPAGRLTLLADAAGFARYSGTGEVLAPGGSLDLAKIPLSRGKSVRGRVLDPAGAPVADAEVRAGALSGARELNVFDPPRRCDREGRFVIEGLPLEWRTAVLARRGAPGAWSAGHEQDGEWVIELAAEQELVVEVLDAAGAPVVAPRFEVRNKSSLDPFGALAAPLVACEARALDASAGRWSLGKFACGSYLVVARVEGLAQVSGKVEIDARASGPLRLVLRAPRRVEIVVLDAATRVPLAGARVRAEAAQGAPPALFASSLTGSDGRALLALDPEEQSPWLQVEHARFAPFGRVLGAGPHQEVALTPGARLVARLADPELARRRCMLTLEFRGSPERREFHLPRLLALPREGALELEHLAAGSWSWSLHESLFGGEALSYFGAENEALSAGEFRLVEGQTHELALSGPPRRSADSMASLSGAVRVGGRAWEEMDVSLLPLEGDGQALSTHAIGRFHFDQVAPGRHLLLVVSREGGTVVRLDEELELAPGEERVIEFDRALHSIDVQVLRDDGAAVQGALVRLVSSTRTAFVSRQAETSSGGLARFTLPEDGAFRVLVSHPEFGTGSAEVVLGETRTCTVRLSAGVECAGRVHFEPALRVADGKATLSIQGAGRGAAECSLEIVGGASAFRVVGLQPGRYDAWLQLERRALRAGFTLSEQGSSTLELRFTKANEVEIDDASSEQD